jgi:hypothetical protein
MFKARPPGVVTRHAITTSVIDIRGEAFANPVEPERPQHA